MTIVNKIGRMEVMMNTLIIQPPLVQLNTPYPSGAYLLSFFKKLYDEKEIQGDVCWFDFSTELFHRIFCRNGLKLIFEKSQEKAVSLAGKFEKRGDENSAFQLRRYVCQSGLWIKWIDEIVAIVCGDKNLSGREFTHEFVRSAHAPRGNRVENFLSGLNRDVGVDDCQIIASLALADLADFITAVYDKNFALIRYGEHLAVSTSKFEDAVEGLSGPILEDFYKPLLKDKIGEYENQENLVLVSVPFPGCFEAGLYTGKFIKNEFGKNNLVCMGGGYVNTELREISECRIFEYVDILSYDKGYGGYLELFDKCIEKNGECSRIEQLKDCLDGFSFYKIKYLIEGKIVHGQESNSVYEKKEREIVKNVFPDFSGIDFSKCPRLADDTNPMHRIWNDGAWLKAYMAYGCYWHRCAFCDTSLDYVGNYCGSDVNKLFDALYNQSKKAGVFGIHFVDEACPPIAMQKFALRNIAKGKETVPLTWWGNIRFEKSFNRDLADLLSYGGLTAVSAGIEIATGTGLESVNKGIDMENIVSACCAFKEAGILIHSYMIYGFWNQTEQDLINSMETLRQLFAAGLLDSAFWHRFSLTKHSTVYKEWREGKHKDLNPINSPKGQFAENEIHWVGEEKSEKYTGILSGALENWMHGEKLEKRVDSYFPYKMPSPTIPKNFVDKLIEKYEQKRDHIYRRELTEKEKFVWIGGKVVSLSGGQICWTYMGEMIYADIDIKKEKHIVQSLNNINAELFDPDSSAFDGKSIIDSIGKKLFYELRGKGLCKLS